MFLDDSLYIFMFSFFWVVLSCICVSRSLYNSLPLYFEKSFVSVIIFWCGIFWII